MRELNPRNQCHRLICYHYINITTRSRKDLNPRWNPFEAGCLIRTRLRDQMCRVGIEPTASEVQARRDPNLSPSVLMGIPRFELGYRDSRSRSLTRLSYIPDSGKWNRTTFPRLWVWSTTNIRSRIHLYGIEPYLIPCKGIVPPVHYRCSCIQMELNHRSFARQANAIPLRYGCKCGHWDLHPGYELGRIGCCYCNMTAL